MTEDELLGAARQAWPTRVMVLVLFCAVGSPKVRPSDACPRIIARSVTDGIGGVGEISGPVPVGRDTVGDHETDPFSLDSATQQLAAISRAQPGRNVTSRGAAASR